MQTAHMKFDGDTRYDRRVRPEFLDHFLDGGVAASRGEYARSAPYSVDLQMRHSPKTFADHATLYVGLTAVLNVLRKGATGLRFAYRGKTDVAPKRFSKYPEDTQLILGWGPPKATGEAAGVGGAQWDGSTGRIVHGYVVLNYEEELEAGFGRGPATGTQGTLGQLMMHELGHAVGLQHVKDDQQIMYPTLTRKKATWGAGDRNGLRKVGKAAGCF